MTPSPAFWCLVVPVKRLVAAKSRLAGFLAPDRAGLALAFALDTVEAALACTAVRAVVAVTDEPLAATQLRGLGARVVPDTPRAGLNEALLHGAKTADLAYAGCGVGALAADLPALRTTELAQALRAARSFPSSYVADTARTGTTLLLARSLGLFAPRFGPQSASAHSRAGAVAVALAGLESLRRDVDTEVDLDEARALGLGTRTRAVLAGLVRTPPEPGATHRS